MIQQVVGAQFCGSQQQRGCALQAPTNGKMLCGGAREKGALVLLLVLCALGLTLLGPFCPLSPARGCNVEYTGMYLCAHTWVAINFPL